MSNIVTEMKKFLLIDDHPVVRSGVKCLLNEYYKANTVDEAENEMQVIEKIRSHSYDLIFLDINIPNTNTLALLKHLLISSPAAKVLVFSMNVEKMHAKRYLDAGAMGYLSKNAPVDEINKAINLILNNRKYYSQELIETLITRKDNANNNPFEKLTEREFEIVQLFLAGKSLTEIAALLHIERSTTGTHKAKIFEKLNVKNMVELIELANMHNKAT